MAISERGREATALEQLNELVLRLSIIAEEGDGWTDFRLGKEDKQVVIDRTENRITDLLRKLEDDQRASLKNANRLLQRALKAESEWEKLRDLVEDAQQIIEDEDCLSRQPRQDIADFLTAAKSALSDPAPDRQ